jgi:hypothetical protein
MKPAVPAALLLALLFTAAVAPQASADPRMETNDNFCHFILDPLYTDNEVFVAGCDSSIVTVEPPPAATTAILCEQAVAQGYGKREVVVPQSMLKVPVGSVLTLTSKDSQAACTMVESNGRAYRSYDWRSTISVKATAQPGQVLVRYVLLCLNGQI